MNAENAVDPTMAPTTGPRVYVHAGDGPRAEEGPDASSVTSRGPTSLAGFMPQPETGPVSGCGMNPARDVGTRLVTLLASGPKTALGPSPAWTYTLGPVLGAIVGSTAFSAFKSVLHAKPDA